ncbi:rRNA maturation RNase YbeY [Leeia sp.]|uniref:rRNA maturation RNase YbeY n=1 Tax=Leeia sp. TaxID=2884678 RepID=UPI0035ADC0FA
MSRKQLHLTVQCESKASDLPSRKQWQDWATVALPETVPVELTLRIVDAEEGQQLNREYRGKDYATNVLTFTFDDDGPLIDGMPLLGDIVLCAPVVAREAAEQGKALHDHYAHLLIHGMLHLRGYDHLEDDEAEEMEALETRLLAGLGIADPYIESDGRAIDD